MSQKLSKWGKALLIVGIGALSAFFIIDQIKKTENEVKQQLKPFEPFFDCVVTCLDQEKTYADCFITCSGKHK